MKPDNGSAQQPVEPTRQSIHKSEVDNPEDESFKKLAVVSMREWAEGTTGHGLPHLIRCKRWDQRIIWVISILISIGLCTFMVTKAILQYLEFGVVTQIRVQNEERIIFPVVSFCATNPFISAESDFYLLDYYQNTYNLSISSYNDISDALTDGIISENDADWLFYTTFDPSYNDSFRRQFGFPDWRAFTNCTFNSKRCNLSEMEWWYSPYYGNCYKFNSGRDNQGNSIPLKTVRQEGDGLFVEFFTGYSDTQFAFYWQPKELGVTILIEDQDNFPIRKTGSFAQPGTFASIVLKRTVSKSLPEPYGNCVEVENIDTILSNEMKTLGLNYNRRNCMNLCEQKQNIDKIGCYSLRLPKIFNATPCSTRAQYDRLITIEYNSTLCDDLCPFECEKKEFGLQISYAGFPSNNYFIDSYRRNRSYWDSFFPNTNFEAFKYSMVPVSIYFDELTTTTIEESAALSIVDLVAYVGGTLGLFVGISVLTFTEFMVLMIDITYFYFSKPHGSRMNRLNKIDVTPRY